MFGHSFGGSVYSMDGSSVKVTVLFLATALQPILNQLG